MLPRFVNLQNKWPIFDGVKIRRTVDGGKNPQAQREPGETRWRMGAQRDFGARSEGYSVVIWAAANSGFRDAQTGETLLDKR